MTKPLIFVTNDDGIHAPGIRALISCMRELGNILVVAPEKGQSGMSHALTVNTFLRPELVHKEEGYEEYRLNGTPVDCFKLAKHVILGRNPDICVSGINHGSNASINVLYSGTMSAAIEGSIYDVPSMGFSLDDYSQNADFSFGLPYIKKIVLQVLEKKLPRGTCLNVNIPKTNNIKGYRVTRHADAIWEDAYLHHDDPHGRPCYWLTGDFVPVDKGTDTDIAALTNGYISIVPVKVDFTDFDSIEKLKNWNFNA